MRPASEAERRRLNDLFAELCAIPSPFGREAACAARVREELESLGLHVTEDDAAAGTGAQCGNLLARIPGRLPRSILLCAHVDTVGVEGPIEPVVVDDGWESAGETILGADNKAAVAVMLEAVRLIVAENRPHSGIELLSACVLYWRLSREARAQPGEEAVLEGIERRTARFGGCLLFALALYVLIQAGYGLWSRGAAERSWLGIGVAVAAAVGMPALARAKIRVADEIGSRALRADAMETFTCGYLSWVLLAGLVANALLHWWWLDSVAALVLVPLLIKEGREAVSGECCGCEDDAAAHH